MTTSRPSSSALGMTCLVVALFAAMPGCAPAVGLRPIAPLQAGRHVELGAGYAAVSPRPVGFDEWAGVAQGWATVQTTAWLDVVLLGAFDGDTGTGGLAVRARWLETPVVVLGVGLELGWGWAALELPVAFVVGDHVVLYSAPQLSNWGSDITFRAPVGAGLKVWDDLFVRGEAQLNLPDFDALNRRFHLGLGLAYQL